MNDFIHSPVCWQRSNDCSTLLLAPRSSVLSRSVSTNELLTLFHHQYLQGESSTKTARNNNTSSLTQAGKRNEGILNNKHNELNGEQLNYSLNNNDIHKNVKSHRKRSFSLSGLRSLTSLLSNFSLLKQDDRKRSFSFSKPSANANHNGKLVGSTNFSLVNINDSTVKRCHNECTGPCQSQENNTVSDVAQEEVAELIKVTELVNVADNSEIEKDNVKGDDVDSSIKEPNNFITSQMIIQQNCVNDVVYCDNQFSKDGITDSLSDDLDNVLVNSDTSSSHIKTNFDESYSQNNYNEKSNESCVNFKTEELITRKNRVDNVNIEISDNISEFSDHIVREVFVNNLESSDIDPELLEICHDDSTDEYDDPKTRDSDSSSVSDSSSAAALTPPPDSIYDFSYDPYFNPLVTETDRYWNNDTAIDQPISYPQPVFHSEDLVTRHSNLDRKSIVRTNSEPCILNYENYLAPDRYNFNQSDDNLKTKLHIMEDEVALHDESTSSTKGRKIHNYLGTNELYRTVSLGDNNPKSSDQSEFSQSGFLSRSQPLQRSFNDVKKRVKRSESVGSQLYTIKEEIEDCNVVNDVELSSSSSGVGWLAGRQVGDISKSDPYEDHLEFVLVNDIVASANSALDVRDSVVFEKSDSVVHQNGEIIESSTSIDNSLSITSGIMENSHHFQGSEYSGRCSQFIAPYVDYTDSVGSADFGTMPDLLKSVNVALPCLNEPTKRIINNRYCSKSNPDLADVNFGDDSQNGFFFQKSFDTTIRDDLQMSECNDFSLESSGPPSFENGDIVDRDMKTGPSMYSGTFDLSALQLADSEDSKCLQMASSMSSSDFGAYASNSNLDTDTFSKTSRFHKWNLSSSVSDLCSLSKEVDDSAHTYADQRKTSTSVSDIFCCSTAEEGVSKSGKRVTTSCGGRTSYMAWTASLDDSNADDEFVINLQGSTSHNFKNLLEMPSPGSSYSDVSDSDGGGGSDEEEHHYDLSTGGMEVERQVEDIMNMGGGYSILATIEEGEEDEERDEWEEEREDWREDDEKEDWREEEEREDWREEEDIEEEADVEEESYVQSDNKKDEKHFTTIEHQNLFKSSATSTPFGDDVWSTGDTSKALSQDSVNMSQSEDTGIAHSPSLSHSHSDETTSSSNRIEDDDNLEPARNCDAFGLTESWSLTEGCKEMEDDGISLVEDVPSLNLNNTLVDNLEVSPRSIYSDTSNTSTRRRPRPLSVDMAEIFVNEEVNGNVESMNEKEVVVAFSERTQMERIAKLKAELNATKENCDEEKTKLLNERNCAENTPVVNFNWSDDDMSIDEAEKLLMKDRKQPNDFSCENISGYYSKTHLPNTVTQPNHRTVIDSAYEDNSNVHPLHSNQSQLINPLNSSSNNSSLNPHSLSSHLTADHVSRRSMTSHVNKVSDWLRSTESGSGVPHVPQLPFDSQGGSMSVSSPSVETNRDHFQMVDKGVDLVNGLDSVVVTANGVGGAEEATPPSDVVKVEETVVKNSPQNGIEQKTLPWYKIISSRKKISSSKPKLPPKPKGVLPPQATSTPPHTSTPPLSKNSNTLPLKVQSVTELPSSSTLPKNTSIPASNTSAQRASLWRKWREEANALLGRGGKSTPTTPRGSTTSLKMDKKEVTEYEPYCVGADKYDEGTDKPPKLNNNELIKDSKEDYFNSSIISTPPKHTSTPAPQNLPPSRYRKIDNSPILLHDSPTVTSRPPLPPHTNLSLPLKRKKPSTDSNPPPDHCVGAPPPQLSHPSTPRIDCSVQNRLTRYATVEQVTGACPVNPLLETDLDTGASRDLLDKAGIDIPVTNLDDLQRDLNSLLNDFQSDGKGFVRSKSAFYPRSKSLLVSEDAKVVVVDSEDNKVSLEYPKSEGGVDSENQEVDLLSRARSLVAVNMCSSNRNGNCRGDRNDERTRSLEHLLDTEEMGVPENDLRKAVVERTPSEAELRIRRSLQKLNLPEWMKDAATPSQGFLLRRSSRDSGNSSGNPPPWSSGSKGSTSSIAGTGASSKFTRYASSRSYTSPCSTASVSPSEKDGASTTGSVFQYPSHQHPLSRWSTSRISSSVDRDNTTGGWSRQNSGTTTPTGSVFSNKSTTSYGGRSQPYLGWRSQNSLNNLDSSPSGTPATSTTPSTTKYLSAAERLAMSMPSHKLIHKTHSDATSPTTKQPTSIRKQPPQPPARRLPTTQQPTASTGLLTPKQPGSQNTSSDDVSTEGATGNGCDIHSSIKEVTSAIVHYCTEGPRSISPRPALSHSSTSSDTRTKRSASPRRPQVWLESSFVGSGPINHSPETPIKPPLGSCGSLVVKSSPPTSSRGKISTPPVSSKKKAKDYSIALNQSSSPPVLPKKLTIGSQNYGHGFDMVPTTPPEEMGPSPPPAVAPRPPQQTFKELVTSTNTPEHKPNQQRPTTLNSSVETDAPVPAARKSVDKVAAQGAYSGRYRSLRFFRGDSILGEPGGETDEPDSDSLAEYCRSQRAKYKTSNSEISFDIDSMVESITSSEQADVPSIVDKSIHVEKVSSSKKVESTEVKSVCRSGNDYGRSISAYAPRDSPSEDPDQVEVERFLSVDNDLRENRRKISMDDVLDSLLALPNEPRESCSNSSSFENQDSSYILNNSAPSKAEDGLDFSPLAKRETMSEITTRLSNEVSKMFTSELTEELNKKFSSTTKCLDDIPDSGEMQNERSIILQEYKNGTNDHKVNGKESSQMMSELENAIANKTGVRTKNNTPPPKPARTSHSSKESVTDIKPSSSTNENNKSVETSPQSNSEVQTTVESESTNSKSDNDNSDQFSIEPFACFPSDDQLQGGTYRLRYSYDPGAARKRPRPKQSQEEIKQQALERQQNELKEKLSSRSGSVSPNPDGNSSSLIIARKAVSNSEPQSSSKIASDEPKSNDSESIINNSTTIEKTVEASTGEKVSIETAEPETTIKDETALHYDITVNTKNKSKVAVAPPPPKRKSIPGGPQPVQKQEPTFQTTVDSQKSSSSVYDSISHSSSTSSITSKRKSLVSETPPPPPSRRSRPVSPAVNKQSQSSNQQQKFEPEPSGTISATDVYQCSSPVSSTMSPSSSCSSLSSKRRSLLCASPPPPPPRTGRPVSPATPQQQKMWENLQHQKAVEEKVITQEERIERMEEYVEKRLSRDLKDERERQEMLQLQEKHRALKEKQRLEHEREMLREKESKEKEEYLKEIERKENEKRRKMEEKELERQRIEKLQMEERLKQERIEQENVEKLRLEQEKMELQRIELERIENEKMELERIEKEKQEKERIERLHKEELERIEREKMELERIEKEKQEKERIERLHKEELERIAKQNREEQRIKQEKEQFKQREMKRKNEHKLVNQAYESPNSHDVVNKDMPNSLENMKGKKKQDWGMCNDTHGLSIQDQILQHKPLKHHNFELSDDRHQISSSPLDDYDHCNFERRISTASSKSTTTTSSEEVKSPEEPELENFALKRQKLKFEIEAQLKQRYQQFVKDSTDNQVQPEKDRADDLKSKKVLVQKNQAEQLKEELQQRLQLRQQQLMQQEKSENKVKQERQMQKQQLEKMAMQKIASSATLPNRGRKPAGSKKPVPPARKSSLTRDSSPMYSSLSQSASTSPQASSVDVSRSPSPPRRRPKLKRPTSQPPSPPKQPPSSFSPPGTPSGEPNTTLSRESSILDKFKNLPQLLPKEVPLPLKRTSSKASAEMRNSTSFEQKGFTEYRQPQERSRGGETDSDMKISWPIQPLPRNSMTPVAQFGEVVRISTKEPGSLAQSRSGSLLSLGGDGDSITRCFSPINNTFTTSTSSIADKPSFRSFSPVSFDSGEQTYVQPTPLFTNQPAEATSTFKKPGIARRVYGSNQDITHDDTNPYQVVNVSGSRRGSGYSKNSFKSGSSDLSNFSTSSKEDAFGFLKGGTNDLREGIISLSNQISSEFSNISAMNITNFEGDVGGQPADVSDIKEMNIAPDSSSDNGNDNTANDIDQTSDSIQMDVCESVDSGTTNQLRCKNPSCLRIADTEDLRILFKSCHNCSTPYCSRVCRRGHWEKHKKICQKVRANNGAREIVTMVRDKEISLDAASAVARRGALGLGRGVVKLFFPDITSAESFIEGNYTPSMHYHTAQNLMPNEMCPDVYRQLMEMCKTYKKEHKFILYVSICVNSEITFGPSKCKRENVSRAAKIKLFDPARRSSSSVKQSQGASISTFKEEKTNKPKDGRMVTFSSNLKDGAKNKSSNVEDSGVSSAADGLETLLLTPIEPLNVSARESRQIAFHNILRHLRERNILLRTQYPEVYKKLSIYADVGETFPPLTIYPKDADSGETLICVIMPETDQNKIRKLTSENNYLRKIDITKPPQNPADIKRN